MHFPCVLLSCEESEQMQSLHKKDLSTKNEADDFYYRPKKKQSIIFRVVVVEIVRPIFIK